MVQIVSLLHFDRSCGLFWSDSSQSSTLTQNIIWFQPVKHSVRYKKMYNPIDFFWINQAFEDQHMAFNRTIVSIVTCNFAVQSCLQEVLLHHITAFTWKVFELWKNRIERLYIFWKTVTNPQLTFCLPNFLWQVIYMNSQVGSAVQCPRCVELFLAWCIRANVHVMKHLLLWVFLNRKQPFQEEKELK